MVPPSGFGPGSQPGEEDGGDLDYLAMPSGMRIFEPHVPYLEKPEEAAGCIAFLSELGAAAAAWTPELGVLRLDPAGLDQRNRAILADALGEGEVAIRFEGERPVKAQESVFAGIWRVAESGAEHIEIGAIPAAVLEAGEMARPEPPMPGRGVVNAPAILTEILDHVASRTADAAAHTINLTLLPHTPEDLDYLAQALGKGPVTILSRGYGNCRIERAAYPTVWRVRYYNSQDVLILDTIEIADIPQVACAAPEDIADSAERLVEIAKAMS
jgi:hydrogenase-1 operon protein HyaF